MTRLWQYVCGLPKTIYFCMKYFPLRKAWRLPIFISKNVRFKNLKGTIIVNDDNLKMGMVKIGFGEVGIFDKKSSPSIWDCNGQVFFGGTANIGHGTKIAVMPNAQLELGMNFTISAESQIVCCQRISFGRDVLISWDCLIMDTDFHHIFKSGIKKNLNKAVQIKDHVWVGCRVTILKGVSIAENTVVAANSNVIQSCLESDCILAGNPARVVDRGIEWSP